ncbi:hypothetical protein PCHDK_000513600, partial [Plasmodium chabaudi adami]
GFNSYNFSNSKCKVKKKSASLKKEDSLPLAPSPEQPKEPSSDQKGSGGDKEKHKNAQSDLKGHNQTSVTNKGDSDDVPGGGSEDSNGGQDAINIVPAASSLEILNAATYLVNATTSFETINTTITEVTDTIKDLYSTALTNLETTYDKYSNVLKEMIDNISTDSKKVEPPSEPDRGGDDQSPLQKDSPQTSSGNHSSDKSDQGVEKPAEGPVITSENPGTETKG